MSGAPGWEQVRRILCVRTDNLGDVLMTTPALRALRRGAPQRHLTLLCSRSGAAAAAFIPEIDDMLVHDVPWASHPQDAGAAADRALLLRLSAGRYDAAVIFTVYSQSPLPAATLCRLAGIPRVLAHCRENPYRLLSDWVRETEPGHRLRHEVQRQLDLVAAIGARSEDARLSFRVRQRDRESLRRRLRDCGIDACRPWLLAHPGATAASRRYPPERFAAALRTIHRRSGLAIVVGGTREEIGITEQVRAACGDVPTASLAGSLSLGECAAAIELATLLVTNNSGPVHIAAAVGTPVVDLYALTNPQHTPWLVPHRLLFKEVECKWCYRSVCAQGHHQCLRGVAPEEVADAAMQLLTQTNPSCLPTDGRITDTEVSA